MAPQRPADEVVVVVADPRLVARHGARRLDPPHQTRGSQRAQHVVDGLVGHLTEILAHDTDDRVRIGVRMVVHRGQHRYPRTRHTESNPAQHALEVRSRWHAPKRAAVPGINQESGVGPRLHGRSGRARNVAGLAESKTSLRGELTTMRINVAPAARSESGRGADRQCEAKVACSWGDSAVSSRRERCGRRGRTLMRPSRRPVGKLLQSP